MPKTPLAIALIVDRLTESSPYRSPLGLVPNRGQDLMESDWANLAGHVETVFDLKALATQLATTGLQVRIARRFGAAPVDYIQIDEGDDFTVQQESPDRYFAEGISSSVERMYAAASRVSSALAALGIRHRFEVSDQQKRLVPCVYHLWPNAEGELP
jgi:hypothetical protein